MLLSLVLAFVALGILGALADIAENRAAGAPITLALFGGLNMLTYRRYNKALVRKANDDRTTA